LIAETEPESLAELAARSGREKSNLSRTLRALETFGLVRLDKGEGGRIVPRVPYSDIVLDLPIGARRGHADRAA
jgi:predicted transcriptional regulator